MKNFDNEIAAQGRVLGAPIARNRVVNTDMVWYSAEIAAEDLSTYQSIHPDTLKRMLEDSKTLASEPGQFGRVKRVLAGEQKFQPGEIGGGMPSGIGAGTPVINMAAANWVNQTWEQSVLSQSKVDPRRYLSRPDPTPKTLDELRKWFYSEFHVVQGERKAWFEEFVTHDDYGRQLASPVLCRKVYTVLALSTRSPAEERETGAEAREAKLCTAMYEELVSILDKATTISPLVRLRRDFMLEHNTMHEFATTGFIARHVLEDGCGELPDGWALDFETDRYRPVVATWAVSTISVRLHMDNANVELSSARREDGAPSTFQI